MHSVRDRDTEDSIVRGLPVFVRWRVNFIVNYLQDQIKSETVLLLEIVDSFFKMRKTERERKSMLILCTL